MDHAGGNDKSRANPNGDPRAHGRLVTDLEGYTNNVLGYVGCFQGEKLALCVDLSQPPSRKPLRAYGA